MSKPSISIVLPVYGVERHIERCLSSVLRQDYDGAVECIIVDDHTPDGSMAIVHSLLAAYSGPIRFTLLAHERNRGLSAARNTGLRQASGDYIFYLDSDDEIMPHTLSTLAALVEKYPGVDLVYGDWYTPHRYNILQNRRGLSEYISDRGLAAYTLWAGRVTMTAPNKLLRRSFVLEHNLFFKEGIKYEDAHQQYFLAEHVRTLAISYVPTYVYFLNPHGITGAPIDADSILKSVDSIVSSGCFWQKYAEAGRQMLYLTQNLTVTDSGRRKAIRRRLRTYASVAWKSGSRLMALILMIDCLFVRRAFLPFLRRPYLYMLNIAPLKWHVWRGKAIEA